MIILGITYEKPKGYEIDRYGKFDWSFLVKVDETLAHGHNGFGGMIRRAGPLWEAKSWSAPAFSYPAASRQEAVQSCLDSAASSLRAWVDETTAHDSKVKARSDVAKVLRVGLPEGVKVWVSNADKLEEPLQFHIEIKNLDSDAVQKFLAGLRISG